MIRFNGKYFDGRSSHAEDIDATVGDDGVLRFRANSENFSFPLANIQVSARLGTAPRYIDLGKDGKIESWNLDAIERIDKQLGHRSIFGIVSWLESHLTAVVFTTLLTALSCYYFISEGIPSLAEYAAHKLPLTATTALDRETLASLDLTVLDSSTLHPATEAEIRDIFSRMVAKLDSGFSYNLEFRSSDTLGANAFALPAGTIILTDQMVRLSRHRDELSAILAHEMGHVEYRHQIRRLIQDSVLALAILLVTGDISSTAVLAATLPALVIEARYSQELESEADEFARAFMLKNDIRLGAFADIMQRLDHHSMQDADDKLASEILNYLSAHPPTHDRVAKFRAGREGISTPRN